MEPYTQNQLAQRNKIIQSQVQLWNLLDSHSINKLVHLFDKNIISAYIINERNIQGLNNSDTIITSVVYNSGRKKDNPTLHLQLKKNMKDFLHLSIHLAVDNLNSKNAGVIHIVKNIYDSKLSKSLKHNKYALISVHQPSNKPHSLEFFIADGYTTPGIQNTYIYDPDIQKEMDVIITVLNRLFDEDNQEYYIGNKNLLVPIYKNTNTVLESMNKHNRIVSRVNKGILMLPPVTNTVTLNINPKVSQKSLKQSRKNKKQGPQKKRYTKKKALTLRNPSRDNIFPKTT